MCLHYLTLPEGLCGVYFKGTSLWKCVNKWVNDLNIHKVSILMPKVTEYLSVKFRDTGSVLNDNAVYYPPERHWWTCLNENAGSGDQHRERVGGFTWESPWAASANTLHLCVLWSKCFTLQSVCDLSAARVLSLPGGGAGEQVRNG